MSDVVLIIAAIATFLYADRQAEHLDHKPQSQRGIGEMIVTLLLYGWAFWLYVIAVSHALGWA